MMKYVTFLLAGVISLTLIFAVAVSGKRLDEAVRFFSDALSAHDAQMTTREDIVSGYYSYAENLIRAQTLSLAYERLLARRSPVFGLAGVDTHELRRATEALAESQEGYALAQKDADDAALVRTTLYPIEFLRLIADLEDARRAFAASGSERDAHAYRSLLRKSAKEGLRYAKAIRLAVQNYTEEESFEFRGVGGTISDESLHASLDALVIRFERIEDEIEKRARCIKGHVADCTAADIALTPPPASEEQPLAALSYVPFAPWASGTTASFVVLDKSTCIRTEKAPYVFAFLSGDRVSRIPFVFRGNLFYAPTEGSRGATMAYLRETLHIKYSIINPLEFYLCPDVSRDLGAATAVRTTADFARLHPGYATSSREKLLAGPGAQETLARSYLLALIDQIAAQHDFADLIELEEVLNLWDEQAGHMDMLVESIAAVNQQDLQIAARGIPYAIDARTLFLTRTAFPSLLLTQSSVSGVPAISIRDAARSVSLPDNLTTYHRLILIEDPHTIRESARAFLEFEGILKP